MNQEQNDYSPCSTLWSFELLNYDIAFCTGRVVKMFQGVLPTVTVLYEVIWFLAAGFVSFTNTLPPKQIAILPVS